MLNIKFSTDNYNRLSKYIVRENNEYYLCINNGKRIRVDGREFIMDIHDFVKVDMFLVDKGILYKYDDPKLFVKKLIEENYIEGIDYLIETDFFCAPLSEYTILTLFYDACQTACIDIIMAFIGRINWEDYGIDETFNDTFGIRDGDIIRVILDNVTFLDYIDYQDCALRAIVHGKLQNFLLLQEKYPHLDILEHQLHAVINGHIEIVEYMVSKGADLQEFVDCHGCGIKICAQENLIEMIEYIFDKVVLSKDMLDTFLQKSSKYSAEYVDLLIDAGADFVTYGEELCQKARKNGNHELAEYLLKNYL